MRLSLRVGAFAWASSAQFYLVQAVVQLAWPVAYSLRRNPISDLGNTRCGDHHGVPVCSPDHALMNLSLVALGCTMLTGAVALRRHPLWSAGGRLGCAGVAVAGLGTILVGAFPENTSAGLHALGAAGPFFVGNAAMISLGAALGPRPAWLKAYTAASGTIGLVAAILYVSGVDLGLGPGGIERVAAYPLSVWTTVLGSYVARRQADAG